MREVIKKQKILDRNMREVERTVYRCDCGEEILCAYFTNTCHECGADYNMSGQRLAPREQWGEETGEHPSDIANLTGDEEDYEEDYDDKYLHDYDPLGRSDLPAGFRGEED